MPVMTNANEVPAVREIPRAIQRHLPLTLGVGPYILLVAGVLVKGGGWVWCVQKKEVGGSGAETGCISITSVESCAIYLVGQWCVCHRTATIVLGRDLRSGT